MLKNRLILACVLTANIVFAQQNVQLVKDINTVPGSQVRSYNAYDFQGCVPCGNYAFFMGVDALHGRELWRTDGTAAGTQLVKDVWEGPYSGMQLNTEMFCLNNLLIFRSGGVWRSDGTAEGTVPITYGFVNGIAPYKDQIVYKNDEQFFITTTEPKQPGDPETELFHFPKEENEYLNTDIMASENYIYAIVRHVSLENGSLNSTELWVHDGEQAHKLKTTAEPDDLMLMHTTLGDKLVFSFDDPDFGLEFWITDGTDEGTKMLADMNAGTGGSNTVNAVTINGKILLGQQEPQRATWISDGTPEGTSLAFSDFSVIEATQVNDKIYMRGYYPFIGYSILSCDLDFEDAQGVVPPSQGSIFLLTAVNGKLLFQQTDEEHGNEVFYVDAEGTGILKDINPGTESSYARGAATIGNVAVFFADDGTHGFELWRTDGSEEGTQLVKDIATNTGDAKIGNIYSYNDKLYFHAVSGTDDFYSELWETDGTESGTQKVDDGLYSHSVFAPVGDQLVLLDAPNGDITKTNLNTGTTSKLSDLPDAGWGSSYPNYALAVGDDVYFYLASATEMDGDNLGNEVWRANPVTDEFNITKDIAPGFSSSDISFGIRGVGVNGKLVFSAHDADDNFEPWVTDGTEAGTFMLKNIVASGGSSPDYFTALGNHALFYTIPSTGEISVWSTDGTSEGTVLIKQTNGAVPGPFGILNGKAYFTVMQAADVPELWTTDGTVAGTSRFLALPEEARYVTDFMNTGSKTYFVVDSKELWVSDGTIDNTEKVNFSFDALQPGYYVASGDTLVFEANGTIWATLGDASATEAVAEAQPASPLYAINGTVYFLMDHTEYGRELFKSKIPHLEIQVTVTGLEESTETFRIFPNPAENTLYVNVNAPSQVKISDLSGREFYNTFITRNGSIDISSFSPGMYLVKLNNKAFYKFIKR